MLMPHHHHRHKHGKHAKDYDGLPEGVVAIEQEASDKSEALTDELIQERTKIHQLRQEELRIEAQVIQPHLTEEEIDALEQQEADLEDDIESEFTHLHQIEEDRDQVMQMATGFKTKGLKSREIFAPL